MSNGDGRSSGPGQVRPRRSRACNTCRRRKVKCDERRPTCQRCEKSSRICLGYVGPLVFVNIVTGNPGVPSDGSEGDVTGNDNGTINNSVNNAVLAEPISDSSSAELSPFEDTLVRPPIHLGAYRDQIVISHLIFKLSIRLDNAPSHGIDAPALSAVLTRCDYTSAAYLAGLSFAEALFGRVYKLDGMVYHSVRLYNHTLQNLRRDLQLFSHEMHRPKAYRNLWGTVLLGMYELVSSTGASNWLEHSRGLCTLTALLGPYAFQSPGAHELLTTFRTNIVIACIVDRRRCFLERLEWKTIPWATRTQDRSIGDFLRDIFCDLPGILEKADSGFPDSELRQRISAAIQRTDQLRWRWGFIYSKACWERHLDPQASSSLDAQGKPLFNTVLDFEEFERAVEILYFDAIRLVLFTLSDQAGLREPPLPVRSTRRFHGPRLNADILPGHGTRMTHALEICRIVDYFMDDKRGSRGAMILFFPLSVARTHLDQTPHISTWVAQVLGEMSSKRGWSFGGTVVKA